MIVMARMSSGKGTLINALLGEQLLLSKNEACTSKKYSIIDDDSVSEDEDGGIVVDIINNYKIFEQDDFL